MAEKEISCDPCSEESKTNVAVKYCSDCEQHLCVECAESHLRFKALRSHHLIDLAATESRIPSSAQTYCDLHSNVQLDFYCSHHDTVCCRACIPDCHSSCKQVYPLDFASKNVRTSDLLSDALEQLKNLSETLDKVLMSREVNIKLLAKSKSYIIKQIHEVKEHILKSLDDLEQRLIAELANVEEKKISTMTKEKAEISKLDSLLKSQIEELKFLKEYGSNNQLFLAVQKQIPTTQREEGKVKEMMSSIKETDIKFERNKDLEFKSIGSITVINRPCGITYTTYKSQQAQVQPDTVKLLTEFNRDGEVKLKSGEKNDLRGIAVTADNTLLICNNNSSYPKIYIYKNCKTYEKELTCSSPPYDVAVIPCSHTAVVTVPFEKSVQFINTTNYTMGRKIGIRVECYGVLATKDRIYLGGNGTVHILVQMDQ